MKVSILIPVFNEEKTVAQILEMIEELTIPHVVKEIIIINDGSYDGSVKKINQFLKKTKGSFQLFHHKKNLGKGLAIRTGIKHATGEYIIIQDADLEYNPHDIIRLVGAIKDRKRDVIYGTRLKRLPHLRKEEATLRFLIHYTGNKFLSLITSLLYGSWITDVETCYKLFPRKAVSEMKLNARGFEFEPEITAKLLKKKMKIIEVPIITIPRGYKEGKKLRTVTDGLKALWTLLKYRVTD